MAPENQIPEQPQDNQTPEMPAAPAMPEQPAQDAPQQQDSMPVQQSAPVETGPMTPQADPAQAAPAAPVSQNFGPAASTQPMTAPAAPMGSPQPAASMPTPKKSRKGLIITLIVLAVVILASIVGVLVWFNMFYVAKADYQAASDAYSKASLALDDVHNFTGVSSGTLTSAADQLNSKADSYMSDVTGLSKLKAVKNDSDVKKSYDALQAKSNDYVKAIPATAVFVKANDKCSSVSTVADVNACISALRAVKDSGVQFITDYSTAEADYLQAQVDHTTSTVNLTDAQSKFDAARVKSYNDVHTAGNDFKTTIDGKIK